MPTTTENLDWVITCPELLEGLVDAVRICSLQVKHPLCLRKNQRPLACGVGCNDSRNLAKLANELVNIVITNPNYVKILHWRCTVCFTPNIGSVTCTTCPKDSFKNSPLYNLLAKHFSQFFKSLVSLISSNPPTNYAPSRVTKFSLIVTILTSHGLKWHALLPINHKMSYNCTCKPPPASPPTESPPKDLLDDDDDDMLHLDCSSESLYEVRKISLPHLTNNGQHSKLFLIHINTQTLITAKIIIVHINHNWNLTILYHRICWSWRLMSRLLKPSRSRRRWRGMPTGRSCPITTTEGRQEELCWPTHPTSTTTGGAASWEPYQR